MSLRAFGMVAGIGALTAFSAQAQEPIGDPVDRLLQAQTLSSADTPPPAAPPVAQQPPPPPVSLTPMSSPQPAVVAVSPPAATVPAAATLPASDLGGPLTPAPALPTERWSGFYVGANFGGGNTSGGGGEACNNTETGTTSGCDIIPNGALSTSGVLGGGQFGYMTRVPLSWNLPPLVVGGEVDFDGSGISGSQNVSGPFSLVGQPEICSPCNFSARQSLNSFTTIRARVGMPLDNRFLLYATGGVALGGVKVSQDLAFLGSSEGDLVTKKDTLAGPVFGAGLEFALPGPWSARIEGLYYDLGKLNTTAVAVNGAPSNFNDFKTFGFRGGIVRFAVNLRLGDLPY